MSRHISVCLFSYWAEYCKVICQKSLVRLVPKQFYHLFLYLGYAIVFLLGRHSLYKEMHHQIHFHQSSLYDYCTPPLVRDIEKNVGLIGSSQRHLVRN